MVGHCWLFGRMQKVSKKSEMFSAPSYKMGKFFLALTKNICGWGEYIPWKIMMQIQTTKKFLGSGNKREKHTKSFFFFVWDLYSLCFIQGVFKSYLKKSPSPRARIKGFRIMNYKPFFRWGTHLYMSLFLSVCPSDCSAPYLRNHTSSDHNLWYTFV